MKKKIKILYYGSCWPTNIGNAFVNLGAINSIKLALGEDVDIYHFGGLSSFLFRKHNYPQNNLNISDYTYFDYVVIGGMTQCVENFEAAEIILNNFLKNGTKIIISGGGAGLYNDEEVQKVREWMKKIPIYGFISRDTYSYEKYSDLACYSLDGIDSAFFISDNFIPLPLVISEFNVLNFDFKEEPVLKNVIGEDKRVKTSRNTFEKIIKIGKRLVKKILGRDTSQEESYERITLDMDGRIVFRTHHVPWPTDTPEIQFQKKNTLISDLPSDYLSLYAQANTVYSERIHACIATLSFGNKAMLFGKKNPRLRMFERVGAGEIINKPVKVDMKLLDNLKKQQVEFLSNILTKPPTE
ncbi:MAG: hypothetical protein CVU89_05515 [Firmicutes bacterium HGW-Firmicutes-14]|nr:MAG: hypothetical protein CVU89_05515 [Firmicutes bacterium HGW-Firmicutes-14]